MHPTFSTSYVAQVLPEIPVPHYTSLQVAKDPKPKALVMVVIPPYK